jgi:hypothetical protein
MAQHARPSGPAAQNNAAAFSPEMAVGVRSPQRAPIRERWIHPPLKAGWQTAQTTHVAAAFTPDMIVGSKPPSPVLFSTRRALGTQLAQTTPVAAPFTADMVDGWMPDRNRERLPLRTGLQLWVSDVIVFSVDMTEGHHLDEPRLFQAPRLPLPESNPTHIATAFSPDMADGWFPDRNRERLPLRLGWSVWRSDIVDVTPDMTEGAHPDEPRLFAAPRLPPPDAQAAQIAPPISPEMLAGWQPPQARPYVPPKFGWSVAQTTQVDAAFSPEMTAGWVPLLPALFSTRKAFGTQLLSQPTHIDAAFSQEMIAGSKPDRSRDWLPVRLGWSTAQLTPAAAAFSVEMVVGLASIAHLPFRAQAGSVAATPDVQIFSVEMVVGSHPDLPRIVLAPRIPLPVSQPTHVATAFSPDMAAGAHPDRNRQVFPASAGWSIAQVTQVDAAFSVEMSAGLASVAHLAFKAQAGWLAQTPDIQIFSVDMVVGAKPDRARLFLAPRLPLPVSQTTPVAAAFTPDMVAGWVPLAARGFAVHPGRVVVPPDVLVFSVEMAIGARPERPRLFLAPKIALPLAQTTPVAAPFGQEMAAGSKPDRNRERLLLRTGVSDSQTSPIEAPLNVEMTAGSQPDKNRERLPLRTGLRDSQTTHVSAPFGSEMVIGHHPDTARGFAFRRAMTGPWAWLDSIFASLPPDVICRVLADVAIIRTLADVRVVDAQPDVEKVDPS